MKKRLKNNLVLKLLALLFAFLLWLLVVNIDDPVENKTYKNIPVTVENETIITRKNQTYQIVDSTQNVSVTISAKRSILNKIKADNITASADMKELYLESMIPITVTVPEYEGRYKEASSLPGNLQVTIEENASKKFPITPMATGTVRDGYVLGAIKAEPETVSINGPASVLNRINRVVAEVNVSGLAQDSTLESSIVLYDADNNVIDQALVGNNLGEIGVSVNATLLHTKNVQVILDTSNVRAADGFSVAGINFEPQEIQIAGKKELLDTVEAIHVPTEALENEWISTKTEMIVDITPYLPEEIQLVDENAGNLIVTVTVQKEGTKSFDLPVGSITVNNLKEDFKLRYKSTEDLEIHIRGPQDVLDGIVIADKASIDFKDMKESGTFKVPVKVVLPQGCTLENEVQIEVILEKK